MINLTSYEEKLPEYILPGAVNARCPIPDRRTLTDDQLELLIRYIDIWLNTGHKIYIHCKGGHWRSATVCAAWYKRKYGLDGTKTLQIIHQAHQNRLIIKTRFRKTGAPKTATQKAQIIRI